MNILILNTSFSKPYSCVVKGSSVFYPQNSDGNVKHSEDTLVAIDNYLNSAGITINDIDVIAVNLGPGSFTGIRVGVALAKGFACASEKKLIAFNSMEQILAFCKKEYALLEANSEEYYYGKVDNGSVEIGIVDRSATGYIYSSEEDINKMVDASIEVVLQKIEKGEIVTINELNHIYLKLSQAEREL